jgi:hypothetical protein
MATGRFAFLYPGKNQAILLTAVLLGTIGCAGAL